MLRGSNYRVDPWQWCAKGRSAEGQLPLIECRRLLPQLVEPGGAAAYRLIFGKLADRHIVWGSVRAKIQVACQRCLEAMPLRVHETVKVAFVRGLDEANRLPVDLDACVVEDETIDLRALVEDELLLAIPVTPRHELHECAVELKDLAADDLNEQPDSPFAALAALRGGRRKAD